MNLATPIPVDTSTIRLHTAFDLEVTLVAFLMRIFAGQRLDNPTLNLAQASAPAHPIVLPPQDPDEPPVSYDFTDRAQTLALKLPPTVSRGRVPRTVTGEIAVDRLADVPNIVVQAVKGKVENDQTIVTTKLLFSTYDENPNSQGYQDVLNMIEAAAIALTSFGQGALDKAYPIVMPIEWMIIEEDCFPHFVGEMTTQWQLPSGRPLPDADMFGIVPAEHIEVRVEEELTEGDVLGLS
jgi:hypothetical protein